MMFIIVLKFNTDIISVMLSQPVLCSADNVISVMTLYTVQHYLVNTFIYLFIWIPISFHNVVASLPGAQED